MAARCFTALGILAFAFPANAQETIYDSQGFESFTPGPLNSQNGWVGYVDTNAFGVPPQVIAAGAGNQAIGSRAIRLEVPDTSTAVSGMDRSIADLLAQGYTQVTVAFDIYQQASLWSSNVWWYWFDLGYPTYGLMWDVAAAAYSECWALGFEGTYPRPPVVFNQWKTVVQTWDFTTNTAVATYNNFTIGPVTIADIDTLTGWGFYLAHDEATGSGPEAIWIDNFKITGVKSCYPNCDQSTGAPLLTANDFVCFINAFAASAAYANCDASTGSPSLTANDFVCFINQYAAGCS